MPCSEKRARLLLERGRARVHRLFPFSIRLIDRHTGNCQLQPVKLKIHPGSKTTGIALVRETRTNDPHMGETGISIHVLNQFELIHRGQQISAALTARRRMRDNRRRRLRYRAARFLNRRKPKGWLPPSLRHRVHTTTAWVRRLQRLAPVSAIAQELVRFDTQRMQNPDISGVEYQQGTLAGYEVRQYLLEKWGRQCAYCGTKKKPLQIDHIHPKARGGSDRVSNLALACEPCNQKKGALPVERFLARKPDKLRTVLAQAKKPLRDAAAVNTTRWALFHALAALGLPLTTGSGGRTQWNRSRLGLPKTPALQAVCVGDTDAVVGWNRPALTIKATGRGTYQRTNMDGDGHPCGYLIRQKRIKGFQTGDMVIARVPAGKNTGVHRGRVAVRTTGRFDIQTARGVIQGVSHKYCQLLQRADGYGYYSILRTQKGRYRASSRHQKAEISAPIRNTDTRHTKPAPIFE